MNRFVVEFPMNVLNGQSYCSSIKDSLILLFLYLQYTAFVILPVKLI